MTGCFTTFRRVGRSIFVLALAVSVNAGGSIGKGVVLHQHGIRRLHMHYLDSNTLQSNAVQSTTFGHGARLPATFWSDSESVRVLAVIQSEFVFTSSTGDEDPLRMEQVFLQNQPIFSAVEPGSFPVDGASIEMGAPWPGRSTFASILLRNHILNI